MVKGPGPSLMGRNWLSQITLDWPRIGLLSTNHGVEDLLQKYADLFKGELGTLKGFKARLDSECPPRFFKQDQCGMH